MSAFHSNSITAENLRRIRAALPSAAFQPDPWKLFPMAAYTGVFIAAHLAVARIGFSLWLLAPIVVAAAALSGIGFYTHDLAHGSILRQGPMRRACELFFWGPLMIAPTIWRRVHNESHHVHYNTLSDPDRQFLASESCASTRWYVRLLYPNSEVFPWNPLVFVHFVPYVVRNTVAALLPARWKPAVVPNRAAYGRGESAIIVAELLALAALQYGLFRLTGGEWMPYLIMAAGTQCLTSCITMAYIFTNHFLNPLGDEADPIHGATSVIVPEWLDRLHANFSYHTEHHLFPAMNSDYYPALSRVLAKTYPDSYTRIPIRAAWRRLWRNQPFVELGPALVGASHEHPASTAAEAQTLKDLPVPTRSL